MNEPTFGVVVRNAKTSWKQIRQLDLRPGDKVVVELAGKVIPHIVRNLSAEKRGSLCGFPQSSS